MWDRLEHRLALLELVATGCLRFRKGQQIAWNHLVELPWTRRTDRRGEIAIMESRRGELERLLTQVWPEWAMVQAELTEAGLPINESGWRDLQDLQRARNAKGLPARLNRRTVTAMVAPHSKAALSALRREGLAGLKVMHDGTVRLRPSPGLRLRHGEHELDCGLVAEVLGEVILTERALTDGAVLTGQPPRALLLVENLGAYMDTPAPHGWLIAHMPGWDTRTARILLKQFEGIPVAHFGDLDPNGVKIMRHLRAFRPDLKWVVPEFWQEYLAKHASTTVWPDDLDLNEAPALVRRLAASGHWLEQEAIVLDSRLPQAITASVESTA